MLEHPLSPTHPLPFLPNHVLEKFSTPPRLMNCRVAISPDISNETETSAYIIVKKNIVQRNELKMTIGSETKSFLSPLQKRLQKGTCDKKFIESNDNDDDTVMSSLTPASAHDERKTVPKVTPDVRSTNDENLAKLMSENILCNGSSDDKESLGSKPENERSSDCGFSDLQIGSSSHLLCRDDYDDSYLNIGFGQVTKFPAKTPLKNNTNLEDNKKHSRSSPLSTSTLYSHDNNEKLDNILYAIRSDKPTRKRQDCKTAKTEGSNDDEQSSTIYLDEDTFEKEAVDMISMLNGVVTSEGEVSPLFLLPTISPSTSSNREVEYSVNDDLDNRTCGESFDCADSLSGKFDAQVTSLIDSLKLLDSPNYKTEVDIFEPNPGFSEMSLPEISPSASNYDVSNASTKIPFNLNKALENLDQSIANALLSKIDVDEGISSKLLPGEGIMTLPLRSKTPQPEFKPEQYIPELLSSPPHSPSSREAFPSEISKFDNEVLDSNHIFQDNYHESVRKEEALMLSQRNAENAQENKSTIFRYIPEHNRVLDNSIFDYSSAPEGKKEENALTRRRKRRQRRLSGDGDSYMSEENNGGYNTDEGTSEKFRRHSELFPLRYYAANNTKMLDDDSTVDSFYTCNIFETVNKFDDKDEPTPVINNRKSVLQNPSNISLNEFAAFEDMENSNTCDTQQVFSKNYGHKFGKFDAYFPESNISATSTRMSLPKGNISRTAKKKKKPATVDDFDDFKAISTDFDEEDSDKDKRGDFTESSLSGGLPGNLIIGGVCALREDVGDEQNNILLVEEEGTVVRKLTHKREKRVRAASNMKNAVGAMMNTLRSARVTTGKLNRRGRATERKGIKMVDDDKPEKWKRSDGELLKGMDLSINVCRSLSPFKGDGCISNNNKSYEKQKPFFQRGNIQNISWDVGDITAVTEHQKDKLCDETEEYLLCVEALPYYAKDSQRCKIMSKNHPSSLEGGCVTERTDLLSQSVSKVKKENPLLLDEDGFLVTNDMNGNDFIAGVGSNSLMEMNSSVEITSKNHAISDNQKRTHI
mmetsp:Transcript_24044/g.27700  ORF Transcript_24044/g.27700 Transcript_24044/m.27700 type:complete len:1041 (-) Transcript_24044:479-3601(-)